MASPSLWVALGNLQAEDHNHVTTGVPLALRKREDDKQQASGLPAAAICISYATTAENDEDKNNHCGRVADSLLSFLEVFCQRACKLWRTHFWPWLLVKQQLNNEEGWHGFRWRASIDYHRHMMLTFEEPRSCSIVGFWEASAVDSRLVIDKGFRRTVICLIWVPCAKATRVQSFVGRWPKMELGNLLFWW